MRGQLPLSLRLHEKVEPMLALASRSTAVSAWSALSAGVERILAVYFVLSSAS
jgi:hypothetical protein